MSTYSTNQARQFYVAKEVKDTKEAVVAKGDIAIAAPGIADYIYFSYMGAQDKLRTDLITKDLVMSASVTHGEKLAKYLHQYDVSLNSEISATPAAGQQYILRIDMLGYASLGIENTYQKFGFVKATTGMSVSEFYLKMAQSLALNFSREPYPIYQFYVSTNAPGTASTPAAKEVFPEDKTGTKTAFEVTSTTDIKELTGDYKKIVIREVSGPWKKGTDEDMPQLANIFTDTILVKGVEDQWGKVQEITNIDNLTMRKDSVYRQLADMEYFYMGERADKYRNVGWPYVISTEYMIDEVMTDKTSTDIGIIDIHYAYVGSNESVQKSEKDCTIVLPLTEAIKLAQSIAKAGVKIYEVKKDGATAITPTA